MNVVKRLRGKSFSTLRRRVAQEAFLLLAGMTGHWARRRRIIDARWTQEQACRWLDAGRAAGILYAPGFTDAQRKQVLRDAERVREKDFSVLHAALPQDAAWPWEEDWRYGHVYPRRDFRRHDHHAPRLRPYDVKYPWEVSRLWFLLPLMSAALAGDAAAADDIAGIIADYRVCVIPGASINDYPMETSMRLVTLCLLLCAASLLQDRAAAEKIVSAAAPFAVLQAEQLYCSVEYSDVAGNHFAANIVALDLAAGLLPRAPQAEKWRAVADQWIEREILRQFDTDGVHVEASTAYHVLVASLFMLSARLRAAQGRPLPDEAVRRLRAACRYVAAVLRPDGTLPVIGDTDDARIFAFDLRAQPDAVALLLMAADMFGDFVPPFAKTNPAAPVLCARESATATSEAFFAGGGVISFRRNDHMLLIDAGAVGHFGRGGHGHNDLLSFELCLDGHALIVDAGCPTYTGDPAARRLFRSTVAHNTVTIDGREMAEILGPFRIADTARPQHVEAKQEGAVLRAQAGHEGYAPVGIVRTWAADFSASAGLTVIDKIAARARHDVVRYLQFAPDVRLEPAGDREIIISHHQHRYVLSFDGFSVAEVLPGRISAGYGHMEDAPKLALRTVVIADSELSFSIRRRE